LTVCQLYEIGGNNIPLHKTYNVVNFFISLIDDQDEEQIEIRTGLTNECIAKLQALDTTLGNNNDNNDSNNNDKNKNKKNNNNNNENIIIPDCFMKTIAWVLGEFGIHPSGYNGEDLLNLLSTRLLQTYND